MFWQEIKEAHGNAWDSMKEDFGRSAIIFVFASSVYGVFKLLNHGVTLPYAIWKDSGMAVAIGLAASYLYALWRAPFRLRQKDKAIKSDKELSLEIPCRSGLKEITLLTEAANNLREDNLSEWEQRVDVFISKFFPGDSYQRKVFDGKIQNVSVQGKIISQKARNMISGRIPRSINISNIDSIEFKLIVLEWIADILTPITIGDFRLMKTEPKNTP